MTESAYRRIPLHRADGSVSSYALVDPEDFDKFGSMAWHEGTIGYVTSSVVRGGRRMLVTLHREVMGLDRGDKELVDHINRNKLDNRRSNLRIVNPVVSLQNTSSRKGSKSRFRGVYRYRGKWVAAAQLNKKSYHIGTFEDELDAGKAAARWRNEHMPFSNEDPELLN